MNDPLPSAPPTSEPSAVCPPSSSRTLARWIGIAANAATAIALVAALIQFRYERAEASDRTRLDVYNGINDQYVQFLHLALEAPWVDCFDDALPSPRPPNTPEEVRTEQLLFATLTALMERAWVFYETRLQKGDPFYENQWPGWVEYAKSFAGRARYMKTWNAIKGGFDKRYVAWFDGLVSEATPRAPK
ncbi:MAG: hypothetical protein K8S98_18195 [Planctomycetes bacterium]|nr:hypothetical protein [Planctomycetota bacterium]